MSFWKPWTWGDESESAIQKRNDLNTQAGKAGGFADVGEAGYGQLGQEAAGVREMLTRLAQGKDSLAGEQLRQGLQSNLSAQRSMAAGASPQNSAMAARNAAMNMGRMGYGMSGQAALAGIQERKSAQEALANMILQQRQQEMQAALQGRGNAISGYGGVTPDKSFIEKWGPAVTGLVGAIKPGPKG